MDCVIAGVVVVAIFVIVPCVYEAHLEIKDRK